MNKYNFYDTSSLLLLSDEELNQNFIISSITLNELENIKTSRNKDFEAKAFIYGFDQDNQSKSKKGVLRGLHFQKEIAFSKTVFIFLGTLLRLMVKSLHNISLDFSRKTG